MLLLPNPSVLKGRKASKLVSEVPTRMAVVNDDWVPVVYYQYRYALAYYVTVAIGMVHRWVCGKLRFFKTVPVTPTKIPAYSSVLFTVEWLRVEEYIRIDN